MILFFYGFLIIIFLVITLMLLVLKWTTKYNGFNKIIYGLWIFFISLPIIGLVTNFLQSKTEIDREEIYGNYTIDREICSGKNADWQYNKYRFKIDENNKMYFYITNKEKIIKTIESEVSINVHNSACFFELKELNEDFHILKTNPTLYRKPWSYYYVFYSEKYGNMFFKKDDWEPIE